MSSLTAKSMLECIIDEELAKYVNFFRSDADINFRVKRPFARTFRASETGK